MSAPVLALRLTAIAWALPLRLLWRRVVIVVADFAADNLSVEREGLQHDIEALTVLVREHQSDVEPEIILTLAANDRIGAVRRVFRLLFVRHVPMLSELWRCPAWAGGAEGLASPSASADRQLGWDAWGLWDRVRGKWNRSRTGREHSAFGLSHSMLDVADAKARFYSRKGG